MCLVIKRNNKNDLSNVKQHRILRAMLSKEKKSLISIFEILESLNINVCEYPKIFSMVGGDDNDTSVRKLISSGCFCLVFA